MDAAIDALAGAGLRAIFVLTDFLWFAPARLVNGVQIGGRRELVRDDALRRSSWSRSSHRSRERYASEPAIAGWDLLNEPEWATLGLGTRDPRRAVSAAHDACLPAASSSPTFRGEQVEQPLSVGLASARALPLVQGPRPRPLPGALVREQRPGRRRSRSRSPSRGLDRPLLLGEFPTRGASLPAPAHPRAGRGRRLQRRARLVAARDATTPPTAPPAPRRSPPRARPGAPGALSVPVYRLDARLLFPPPEQGPAPRADRGRRRPAAGAAAARLLDGHLPVAGRAAALALTRPAHGAARRRAAGLAQPRQDDPATEVPRQPRHGLRRGDGRLRHRASSGPGRHLDHAGDGRRLLRAAPPRRRPLGGGLGGRHARRRPLRHLARRRVLRRVDVRPRARRVEGRLRGARGAARAAGRSRSSTARSTRPTSSRSARASGPGARSWRRCRRALESPTRLGRWRFDPADASPSAPPDARAAAERRAEIVRQRALADEPPTADRVRQREPPGVQHQARHRESRARLVPGPARSVGSPRMGRPACARCTRIWCLRPVLGRASTSSARGSTSRTTTSVAAGSASGPPARDPPAAFRRGERHRDPEARGGGIGPGAP